MGIPVAILLICGALLAYAAVLYPLCVVILSRLRPKPVLKGSETPGVSILIPARNEERFIARKIENSLGLNYPADRLEVIVVSDGSDDGTEEIARRYEGRGVAVMAFREKRGKVRAILDAIPRARGDILVFTDASGMASPGALREIAADFHDPAVGCVCGSYRSRAAAEKGERLYWGYESALRLAESRWATLLGATGALYAVRRDLFIPPPPDTINDDFVIPALVTLSGYRTVLEERAVVNDEDPSMGEFRARVRVAAGNWQQLFILRKLFSPLHPWLFWQFLSHKLLRMLAPLAAILFAAGAFAASPRLTLFLLLAAAVLSSVPGGGWWGLAPAAVRKLINGMAAGLCGAAYFFFKRGRVDWK